MRRSAEATKAVAESMSQVLVCMCMCIYIYIYIYIDGNAGEYALRI